MLGELFVSWRTEIAHWSAFLPIVWVSWLRLRGRTLPLPYWILACGFMASAGAEAYAEANYGSWGAIPYLAVVQLGLFGTAVRGWLGGLLVSAICLAFVPTEPDGAVWPWVVGSLAVMAMAWSHELRSVLALYCIVGTILWLGFVGARFDHDAAMHWWYPYQFTRLASFGLFGWKAWKT